MIKLPDDVLHILTTLWADGHDAYVVGGCVRDSLMLTAPQDWDIATSAAPHLVKQLFPHTFDTGIQHGTVTVVRNRRNYEVTTFRVDGEYRDGRHPSSVTFTGNLHDDLSRRDFTMNAIAYSPREGLADPFGGMEDIKNRIIRCVGSAELRFNEDALRMLRAVRFAAQTGFSVAPDTLNAINPLAERLLMVSAERVREELCKLLAAPYPSALSLLERTGLFPAVLRGDRFGGDISVIIRHIENCPKQIPMLSALFLAWVGDGSEPLMRRLRFDNKTIRETSQYIKWLPVPINPNRYEIKRVLTQVQPELLKNLFTLKTITAASQAERDAISAGRLTLEDIICHGECFLLADLAVNGDDLADTGIARGKPTGDALSHLLDAVMRDPALNRKDVLLSMAKQRTTSSV